MGTLKGGYWDTPEGKEFQKTSPITKTDGGLHINNAKEAVRRQKAWEAAQSGSSSMSAPASAAPVLTPNEGGETSNVKKKIRGKASLKVGGGGIGSMGGTGLSV